MLQNESIINTNNPINGNIKIKDEDLLNPKSTNKHRIIQTIVDFIVIIIIFIIFGLVYFKIQKLIILHVINQTFSFQINQVNIFN